jgi:hypothetical protein
MRLNSPGSKLALLLMAGSWLFSAAGFAKTEWLPISSEDLAATVCKAYPGASAEVIFFKQTLDASRVDAWTTQDTRIKIYSPKGAEEGGVLNIDYPSYYKVWDVAARVTKPNGTSAELGKNDFHDSLFAKVGGYKWNRKTLAVPNLEAGDVVEIKWSQNTAMNSGNYFWWYCQQTIPVRHFSFSINGSSSDYRLLCFNEPKSELKRLNSYQVSLEVSDQPPFSEEPVMAPMRDVRGWFLVLFTSHFMSWFSSEDVWKEITSYFEEDFRLAIKPDSEIKAKAAELTRGAAGDQEKLQRLYDFCQQHVTNYDYFDSAELQKAKKRIDDGANQYPGDTLKRGNGNSEHVNQLFASLAKAAGYEVRLAKSASRDATLQVQNPNGWLFLSDDVVAVRVGQAWSFYAPGDYYVPAGMMAQANELATSLICDKERVDLQPIPASPAAKSPVIRKGRFTLDADGNLEGDVEVSLGGHVGIEKKMKWRNWEPADIDADFRAAITKLLPSAEVGDLTWHNLHGNALPLTVSYKVKVPGYADLAGNKIILVPNVFAHGAQAIFSAEIRNYPVFFRNAWSEHDDIEITLPEGYTLDAASAPANVGDPTGTLGSRYYLGYRGKARVLTYKRDFALGANGAIAFQAASYPAVKTLLDSVNRSDEHAIVFKPVPPAPPPAPASAPANPPPAEPGK